MGNLMLRDDAAQQARQQAVSLPAFALATSAAPIEEISAALKADDLETARRGASSIEYELRPLSSDDTMLEEAAIALGRQVGLMKMSASAEQKDEWISLVLDEVSNLPARLVLRALDEVRQSARFESEVVPAVVAAVQKRKRVLDEELAALNLLIEAAGPR